MTAYSRWVPGLVIVTVALLCISGFLLLPTTLHMRLEQDVSWRLPGDLRLSVVSFHVLLSYLIILLMGALWKVHMVIGYKTKQGLGSGLSLVITLILLTLTGIAIFYLGNHTASLLVSVLHSILGVALPVLFIWHILSAH